jgi:hypothetical protein
MSRARICHCGGCSFFSNESIDGYGICSIRNTIVLCSDPCWLSDSITRKDVVKILHLTQKYRRSNAFQKKVPQPYVVGLAIDEAIKQLRRIN